MSQHTLNTRDIGSTTSQEPAQEENFAMTHRHHASVPAPPTVNGRQVLGELPVNTCRCHDGPPSNILRGRLSTQPSADRVRQMQQQEAMRYFNENENSSPLMRRLRNTVENVEPYIIRNLIEIENDPLIQVEAIHQLTNSDLIMHAHSFPTEPEGPEGHVLLAVNEEYRATLLSLVNSDNENESGNESDQDIFSVAGAALPQVDGSWDIAEDSDDEVIVPEAAQQNVIEDNVAEQPAQHPADQPADLLAVEDMAAVPDIAPPADMPVSADAAQGEMAQAAELPAADMGAAADLQRRGDARTEKPRLVAGEDVEVEQVEDAMKYYGEVSWDEINALEEQVARDKLDRQLDEMEAIASSIESELNNEDVTIAAPSPPPLPSYPYPATPPLPPLPTEPYPFPRSLSSITRKPHHPPPPPQRLPPTVQI